MAALAMVFHLDCGEVRKPSGNGLVEASIQAPTKETVKIEEPRPAVARN